MESIELRATKDQIEELKESVLWEDIVRELEIWKQGFTAEMMSIVDDAASTNPSSAQVLLHMGDLNGRCKAVDYILGLPDIFIQMLDERKKKE